MKTATLVFGLVISLAAVSFAQVRTVTNTTLQKFQEKRLAAERDYRDNYARMGFPSPEELDRQRKSDMSERILLANQLRRARLEKERLELERRGLDLEAVRLDNEIEANQNAGFYGGSFGGFGGYGGYFGGFGGYGGYGGYDSGRRRRGFGNHFPFGFSTPRNQLLPLVDRRGAYRVTPFEVIQVPNPRAPRIFFRGGRRH